MSLGGGSAGNVTLWADEAGGLWARKPCCKSPVLGVYRPVGHWRDEKGEYYYFI